MGRPRIWTLDTIKVEAAKYKSLSDFRKGSQGAYAAAWRRGLLDELGLPKGKRGRKTIWTLEAIILEAEKYQNQKSFRKGSYSAFITAHRNGWLEQLIYTKPKRTYFFSVVRLAAQKYASRSAFKAGSQEAYNAATRNGWLEILFPSSPT